MRPRLLDLFCGAGGAGVGYARAGFDVTGVDLKTSKASPHPVITADVLDLDPIWLMTFDAIHASPPCQRYSASTRSSKTQDRHPDPIEPVRDLLASTGRPYVIENVVCSPLRNPIVLCGSMFPGLRVRRHRLFESNVMLMAPPCGPHQRVYDHGGSKNWPLLRDGIVDEWEVWLCPVGAMPYREAHADAMGIDWITNRRELAQAIPPAYTELIGRQLIEHI